MFSLGTPKFIFSFDSVNDLMLEMKFYTRSWFFDEKNYVIIYYFRAISCLFRPQRGQVAKEKISARFKCKENLKHCCLNLKGLSCTIKL